MIPMLANHLWQSTVFAAAAGLLTLVFRRNRAQARYAIWLAASLKFLIPFSLLVSAGSQLQWSHSVTPARLSTAMEEISRPFDTPVQRRVSPAPVQASRPMLPAVLLTVWLCGFTGLLVFWCMRCRRLRLALNRAVPIDLNVPIKTLSSAASVEPGVFGVFRPVLLLPEGIAERLTPEQLAAVVAHELCHVRRRDNLAAAIHMVVEAVFWFHPLVWWIGARLVEERERACDEEVLRMGSKPQIYAEGILNVCKFYVESPLTCVSGVAGSNLKRRIEEIMTNQIARQLNFGRKLLLATAGFAAVAAPIVLGILNVSGEAFAQTSVTGWFPVHVGDRWIYEHETRDDTGEGPAHLDVHRWQTEETIVGSWPVPEGTLVARQVRISAGSPPEGYRVYPDPAYLIRGDCLYVVGNNDWEHSAHQLTPDFLKSLGVGEFSPDFCFPLVTHKTWGAPHWGGIRPASEAKDWEVVGNKQDTFHVTSVSSYLGSGMTADIWFEKGVGIVREEEIHHGTIGEERIRLLRFEPALRR